VSPPYIPPTVAEVTVVVEGETLTTEQVVVRFAEGDAGAVNALTTGIFEALFSERKPEDWLLAVWSSRLRGADLAKAFTDECKRSASAFVDLIERLAAAGGAL
jgi:hypothetical protein